jgi:phosphomannomutase
MQDHIVLFDMDGTLTPARKPATEDIAAAIRKLTRFRKSKVGIVTGSGLDYLVEQCSILWSSRGVCNPADLILMPCNGTQVYRWNKALPGFEDAHSVSMIKKLKQKKYGLLVSELFRMQADIADNDLIPFTGEFVSYRESLLNWCPIGRMADDDDRQAFIEYDKSSGLRKKYLTRLKKYCKEKKIKVTCALGGQTSIDIYPAGWDKSYALQHFEDYVCWFIGDKCTGTGNDKQIYDALVETGRAYQTTGPDQTVSIINKIIPEIEETS